MATKPKPILPKTRPRSSEEPDDQEPAGPWQPIDLTALASIFLTGLLTGVNDITYLPPPGAASLESSLLSSVCTTLPFTIACILAAAFLGPIVQWARLNVYSLLAPTSLLIAIAHAFLLVLYLSRLECGPGVVMAHLLLGFGNTLSLTTTTLLCRGSTILLGVLHGTVALGVVLRTATMAADTVDGRDLPTSGRKGQHLAVLVLALATAASLLLTPRPDGHRAGENGKEEAEKAIQDDTEAQTHHTPQLAPPATRPEKPPHHRETNAHYPPPASRTTILTALFALAYHATLVALPAGLVSLSPSVDGQDDNLRQLSYTYVTAATFWTGIAIGRFTILPSRRCQQQQQVRSKSQQLVSRAVLVAAGCFLLLFPCRFFSRGTMAGQVTIPAAGLFGIILGPVYPWAVGVLIRGLDGDEALSGVGIVVAFGYAGEMLALLMVQLVAHLDAPVVLYVVIAGLVGGMLVCWTAVMGVGDGETGSVPQAVGV